MDHNKYLNIFYKFALQGNPAQIKDRFSGSTEEERQSLLNAEAEKKGFKIVPKKRTQLDETSVVQAVLKVLEKEYPDMDTELRKDFALTIAPQIKLETGFKSCYNYNVGNVHATTGQRSPYWKGLVFVSDDPQIAKDGSAYIQKDWFWRAFETLEDGVGDWFSLLKRKFSSAIEYAKAGDAYNFALELGKLGYYTANKQTYAKGVKRISDSMKKKREELTSGVASVGPVENLLAAPNNNVKQKATVEV